LSASGVAAPAPANKAARRMNSRRDAFVVMWVLLTFGR
jgi:hypothetical protein